MTRRKLPHERLNRHGPLPKPLAERFWDKVNRDGECWLYRGGIDKDGYGKFWHKNRTYRAHRIGWFIQTGQMLDVTQLLLHSCDTPLCVRADHLYIGTQLDNMLDRLRRGRWRGGRPKKEETNAA